VACIFYRLFMLLVIHKCKDFDPSKSKILSQLRDLYFHSFFCVSY